MSGQTGLTVDRVVKPVSRVKCAPVVLACFRARPACRIAVVTV